MDGNHLEYKGLIGAPDEELYQFIQALHKTVPKEAAQSVMPFYKIKEF